MRLHTAAIALAAVALCAVCLGQPEDKPSPQPAVAKAPVPDIVPMTWEFKFEHGSLRSILADVPGKQKPQLFWYLRYTVTNNSGEDHFFVPEFILYTDTGQLIRAGKSTPTSVYYKIKKLINDPLLITQTSMTGKVLLGDDNAKSGLAIWPDFDPNAGTVDIFIGGLSGETKVIPLPEPLEVMEIDIRGKKTPRKLTQLHLAKTRHLRYKVVGEAAGRPRVTPKLVKKEWVMR